MLWSLLVGRCHSRQIRSAPDIPPHHWYRRGLLALCTCYPLIGGACFAAGDAPTAPPDQEAATLLRTIERQIADGRIVLPPDDNAMDTWRRVLGRQMATPASPGVIRALADFEAHARIHAADAQAAGNLLAAAELTVFADQASRLVGRIPPVDSPDTAAPAADPGTGHPAQSTDGGGNRFVESARTGAPANDLPSPGPAATHDNPPAGPMITGVADSIAVSHDTPQPAAAGDLLPPSSPDTASGSATMATRDAPPMVATATATLGRPPPDAPGPMMVPAVPQAPPASTQPAVREQADAAFFAARGDEMLAHKDISAARRFYEYAANAGSVRAATALARTFDADFITRQALVGLRPDPALAAFWYRKAAASGDPDAEARLLTLRAEAVK